MFCASTFLFLIEPNSLGHIGQFSVFLFWRKVDFCPNRIFQNFKGNKDEQTFELNFWRLQFVIHQSGPLSVTRHCKWVSRGQVKLIVKQLESNLVYSWVPVNGDNSGIQTRIFRINLQLVQHHSPLPFDSDWISIWRSQDKLWSKEENYSLRHLIVCFKSLDKF